MTDPCKECWPQVDPYDCWGCLNIENHLEYIREKLKSESKDIKEESKMADGDCSNCKHIDECGVYEYNCMYGIYYQCDKEDVVKRLIALTHVLDTVTSSIEQIFEENSIDDENFNTAKSYVRNLCDILNDDTYKKYKELIKED